MHIVIVGNGIAGSTAARFIRKQSDHQITMISDETDYFFSRTALMYVFMGHMRYQDIKPYEDWFWDKNRIGLMRATVSSIDTGQKQVYFEGERPPLGYDKLILATGSRPKRVKWPGEDARGVQSLISWQDLELMEKQSARTKKAVVVGGGLIGIEMAEMLLTRGIHVTMLVREAGYFRNVLPAEEAEMLSRHIREHHVDLRLETELASIQKNDSGRVQSVKTRSGETISCQFVGITIGVVPDLGLCAPATGIETDRGILVDDYLQTSIPDVYALGDCAQLRAPQPGRGAIEPVWYTGKMMGEVAARNLCGEPTPYRPGVWFNSAKFFDIEWQTYGVTPAKATENTASLYWQHPSQHKAIRLLYDADSLALTGVNTMNTRYRHELCDAWIGHGTPVPEVLPQLRRANFDPEFFRAYEGELIRQWNERHPGQRVRARKRSPVAAFFGL